MQTQQNHHLGNAMKRFSIILCHLQVCCLTYTVEPPLDRKSYVFYQRTTIKLKAFLVMYTQVSLLVVAPFALICSVFVFTETLNKDKWMIQGNDEK